MYSLIITKENIIWYCFMMQPKDGGPELEKVDFVDAKSYSDLMVEVGNKGWIDLINKNA